MGRHYLSPRRMRLMCERFNARHPVGARVTIFTGLLGENPLIGVVSAPAQILGGHTPVVYIAGRGCVALTHVRPAAAAALA